MRLLKTPVNKRKMARMCLKKGTFNWRAEACQRLYKVGGDKRHG